MKEENTNKSEFMVWFTSLVIEGQERDYPINSEDPESYRSYFDSDYTVEETIDEDSCHE